MTNLRLLELDGVRNVLFIVGVVLSGWLLVSGVVLPPRGAFVLSRLAAIQVGVGVAAAPSLPRRGA